MSRPSSRATVSVLAETLDRLITLELPKNGRRLPGCPASPLARSGIAPDGVGELYATARRRFGGPLADGAAAALLRQTRPGDRLVVTTGLVAPGIPRGETDGPAGAVALARAMILARRVAVVLITEADAGPVLEGAVEALAASERDGALWQKELRVLAFPSDPGVASDRARHLWRELRPAALLSVEKLGPNAQGIIHNMAGQDVTATQARSDLFFPLAERTRALTIGIGDRGNEIGLGGLLSRPGRCACPCRGSFACVIRAKIPVVASSSNWGAYGVTAALAAHLKDRRLLHRPGSEARMLRRMVRAGAVDGITRRRAPTVDGLDLALQTALVGMLGAVVGRRCREASLRSALSSGSSAREEW